MTDRLIVTTVVRHAGQKQASGFFHIADTRTKQVLRKFAVPESAFRLNDPNPRGGLRGARGVSCWGDRIIIANSTAF